MVRAKDGLEDGGKLLFARSVEANEVRTLSLNPTGEYYSRIQRNCFVALMAEASKQTYAVQMNGSASVRIRPLVR